MENKFIAHQSLPEFELWKKMDELHAVFSFDLEITARCNLNCRHCYINLPANDAKAKKEELSLQQIEKIADSAASMGVMWCLITGGEPLLREDFSDIYLMLKKKGFLLSVFTNATVVTQRHIDLFKKYPPRDIEITVYGASTNTFDTVTRIPGSFDAFKRGLDLLENSGLKIRLKAMALRSNLQEIPEIAKFCRKKTKDYFRFDPFLHLRFDGDTTRNEEIMRERLSPNEISKLEASDRLRVQSLKKNCDNYINPEYSHITCSSLFKCGAGENHFSISYNGFYRPCMSLWHKDCIYDLKEGPLKNAIKVISSKLKTMHSERKEFKENCMRCPLINLCMWCPAHAYLEYGKLDKKVEYFCNVAHKRAEYLKNIQS